MRKSLLITALFAAVVTASLGFTADEPQYKNLKILPKNITKPQMDSVMRHFSASLGVKCNFCHVRNEAANTMDFASDGNKHKLIARDMMRMTNKLNKKYFNVGGGKQNLNASLLVTCYTCHHGQEDPEVKAPQAQGPAGGPPPRPGTQPASGADSTKRQQ